MPRKPKRGQSITPPGWWVDEAAKKLTELGIEQKEVVEHVVRRANKYDGSYGPLGKVDQSRVSRALGGEPTPIGLLWLISSVLGVPSPVIIPARLSDARQINSFVHELSGSVAARRELTGADEEFSDMEAGVSDVANKRRPAVVESPGGKVTKRSQS